LEVRSYRCQIWAQTKTEFYNSRAAFYLDTVISGIIPISFLKVIKELIAIKSEKLKCAAKTNPKLWMGKYNIIFQGLTRFIFNYGKDDDLGVEGETLSFIGFTTGIVF